VLGSELRTHFDTCPSRESSDVHNHIDSWMREHKGTKGGYFYAMELHWEADQLLKPPKSVIRRCASEGCRQSNIIGGKYFEECRHMYCKEHHPGRLCPVCHPEAQSQVFCNSCLQPSESWIVLECGHTVCRAHIQHDFLTIFVKTGQLPCMGRGCGRNLLEPEIKAVVGEEEVEKAQWAMIPLQEGCKLVSCPTCKLDGVLEPSQVDYSLKDLNSKLYSRPAAEEYCKNRSRCPRCNTTLCANCKASPYHDALTCEQWASLANGTCRYCEELPPVAEDCCEKQECQEVLQTSCRKVLSCGHRCFGTAGEFTCPPCLVDKCCPDLKSSENEYCCICGSEKLRNRPVLELQCGHFVHYRCLKDRLWKRWPGARITFKFCRCPLCEEWAVPKNNYELQKQIGDYQLMFEQIKSRSLERLRNEPEENKRINDPLDKNYYKQRDRYVIDRFCYYECYLCHSVYFGGKKDCEDNGDQQQVPEELICPNCTARKSGQFGSKNCSLHNADFTEYKCKFCCSVASFFCWGTTHFCESCHKKHNSGDYMNDKKAHQLQQCAGPAQCPLGIKHPPNGTEFILGCSLCRSG